jgi:hypothetical protein
MRRGEAEDVALGLDGGAENARMTCERGRARWGRSQGGGRKVGGLKMIRTCRSHASVTEICEEMTVRMSGARQSFPVPAPR